MHLRPHLLLWLIAPCISPSFAADASKAPPPEPEEYKESLHVRQMNDGKLSTHFAFTTTVRDAVPRLPETLGREDTSQHYNMFPMGVGQILREYAVTEMHLTLNSGRWNYKAWGYPEDPGVATGAELWAWMGEGGPDSVDTRWIGLNNALAGLFCTSLASLPTRYTTYPTLAFRPTGSIPANTTHSLRHATLASERICTENLTPFLKLLPCKDHAGLGTLLNPHKIFDADWHGMGIHVTWDQTLGVTLRMTMSAVFDPLRLSGTRNWSFDSIFGRTIPRPCPAAKESPIRIRTIPDLGRFGVQPQPAGYERKKGEAWDIYPMLPDLNINATWPEELAKKTFYATPYAPKPTDLEISRYLTGAGQAQGGLDISIRNTYNETWRVIYVETMPWFIQFYLHTLQVTVDGTPANLPETILSHPPRTPETPTLLEMPLILPPLSTTRLSIQFFKSFLHYSSHPPDASRGWDLPGAIIFPWAFDNSTLRVPVPISESYTGPKNPGEEPLHFNRNEPGPRMYTHPLLADLATPDFSMPYNVIIMSCTLVAMLWGSVMNLLVRKFLVLPVGVDTSS